MRTTGASFERDLHALIGEIYAAALDAERLPIVLSRLCRMTDSRGVFCFHLDDRIAAERLHEIDPAIACTVRGLQHQNLYVKRRHRTGTGRPLRGTDLVQPEELSGIELFEDYWRPSGIEHILFLPIVNDSRALVEVTLARSASQGAHDEDAFLIAAIATRHLVRASRMAQHLQEKSLAGTQLADVLDALRLGCLVVDARGRLLHANRQGEMILRSGWPLRLKNGRLIAAHDDAGQVWQAVLARLEGDESPPVGSMTRLANPEGPPTPLVAVPLPTVELEGLGGIFERRGAGLVVLEPWGEATGLPQVLREGLGLTAAEADLAAALTSGQSLADHAEERERSLSTVRTHLRSVFAKTGTSRQSELVRMLAALGVFAGGF